MRYPKMNTQRNTMVSVPQLNGGVNLCDMQHAIADNQLSACENVWWLDGALRTRPPLKKCAALENTYSICQRLGENEAMLMHSDDSSFYAMYIAADGQSVPIGSADNYHKTSGAASALACRAPKSEDYEWIFFIDNGDIVTFHHGKWETIDGYHPLVMMNCTGTSDGGAVNSEAQAVTLEAYNMISDKFRIGFMTDGKSTVFTIPVNGEICALSLESGAEEPYTVDLSDKAEASITNIAPKDLGLDDGVYKSVSINITHDKFKKTLTFACNATKTAGGTETVYLPYSETNNLIVTARNNRADRKRITQMRMCTWFGGDQSGLGGGTHLFVAGHHDRPNLVHWSDVNNPLYFPENNYAYIGEDSSAITALAKQGEMLIILRERDIYCAHYVAGEVPTVEEMTAAAAIETTAHKSYFPIAQLHPAIGCRCPQSVQLVNNRLVWADSNGRVYVLAGSSQYSERNVREVSPLVDKALKAHSDSELRAATAGEYEGYYALLVGAKMYLMDAQTSAFNSINYYSREETAQKSLPWYVWTLPQDKYGAFVANGDTASLVSSGNVYRFVGDADDNGEIEETIESSFTTKQFEFGRMDRLKSIGQIYLRLGIREGGAAEITYITDQYSRSDPYLIESTEDVDERNPKFVRSYRLTPNIHRVESFGVRVSSTHRMAIEGIAIQYKNEGVIR